MKLVVIYKLYDYKISVVNSCAMSCDCSTILLLFDDLGSYQIKLIISASIWVIWMMTVSLEVLWGWSLWPVDVVGSLLNLLFKLSSFETQRGNENPILH